MILEDPQIPKGICGIQDENLRIIEQTLGVSLHARDDVVRHPLVKKFIRAYEEEE